MTSTRKSNKVTQKTQVTPEYYFSRVGLFIIKSVRITMLVNCSSVYICYKLLRLYIYCLSELSEMPKTKRLKRLKKIEYLMVSKKFEGLYIILKIYLLMLQKIFIFAI